MYIDEVNGRLKTRATIFAETSAVIPAQAGIQKFEVAAVLKYFPNAEVWIPACAGMTAVECRLGLAFIHYLLLHFSIM